MIVNIISRPPHSHSTRNLSDLCRLLTMTVRTIDLTAGRFRSNKRPAILAVIVLVFILLFWDKVELSHYLQLEKLSPTRNNKILSSPACRPHFQLALPDGNWSDTTKFKRLYFYHARKAGGTNLRKYFAKVAAHHGLKYMVLEYHMAEDPGSYDEATFYVTHLREPVSRSISHFKYENRWDCKQLLDNDTFVPNEENSQKLETWNQNYGRQPSSCKFQDGEPFFSMVHCAVNCYSQWFSGLSCPWWDPPENPELGERPIRRETPMTQQYEVAKAKLLRYNFIVISEMLQRPTYAAAVERFFGVPGVTERRNHPWCEVESHYSNERIPLVIQNETLNKLTILNKIDIGLYHEIKDCLDEEDYDFPAWDPNRFAKNETMQLNYTIWEQIHSFTRAAPRRNWLKRFNTNNDGATAAHTSHSAVPKVIPFSPACRPHFQLALPDGTWTNSTKFKRLYFYHARKAGGTNLKRYFEKVAVHHGLKFASTEYEMAEDPGSYDDATFYVTHLREPVSRSISHFKYEGRWDCKELMNNDSFIPTEDNALKLETWNQTHGHQPSWCKLRPNGEPFFHMLKCAVNCYSQWFGDAGIACPRIGVRPVRKEVSMIQQYHVAKTKLLRYNFIVFTEMLQHPTYAAAVERFFGVPGIAKRVHHPWCELRSHYSNERIPLVIKDKTRNQLTALNGLDISLYHQLKSCLDAKVMNDYDFPAWDPNRFETNETIQVNYTITEQKWPKLGQPNKVLLKWQERFDN
mmetsp:Transcript_13910/g.30325  ORF Transcript_13910/g.30325 Transcript_13910/m.30325 type:complete len:746 (+) Transcript_13910:15-2252(+)